MEETELDSDSSHLPCPECSRHFKKCVWGWGVGMGKQLIPVRRNKDQVEESTALKHSVCPSLLCLTSVLSCFSVFSGEKEPAPEEPGSPVKSAPASPAQSPAKSEPKSPVGSPSKSVDGEWS